MTEIKIKISELKELCNIVSLEGKDTKGKNFMPNPEFLIDASDGELKVKTIDKGLHLGLNLKYKAEIINPGFVMIGNVESFLSYLDRFNNTDEVILSTTENRINIKRLTPYKNARMPQASPESLENTGADEFIQRFVKNENGFYETSKTKFEVKIILNASDVKNVIDDGEAVKQRIYPWTLTNSELKVKVGSDQSGEIESVIPIKNSDDVLKANVKTGYAYGIDNIFGNLIGEVTIFLSDNIGSCPMIVEKNTDKYQLVIILAPVITE